MPKTTPSFLSPSDPGIVPVKEMMIRGTGFTNPRSRSTSPPSPNNRKVYLKDLAAHVLTMGDDTGFKFSEEYEVYRDPEMPCIRVVIEWWLIS